ncbi:MAG: helix-turn-helix domain-containing protein [Pelatocladus maniniholoensis HA4357-MV3]|jgi:putative transcriptional regulator|uniref:Helix-turn-helix domain-containing protein n=1 Tax=Pelatocladus maniniholoensis HA4357-MV3 TaxID=1117104 RepID=A0A9E3H5L0_9NOST|nr:helix-turn-helix domain-containing protein [Pelatocladus maniniholoensis HA4357-MV3]BAZ69614.1 transcriptional regulator [Fischerella sp. NIES-4106]
MPVKIKLKQLREDKGLSQNALARQLEMSLANIQKIEYGKAKSIPLDTLEKICLALDCEIGDLLVIVKSPLSQDEH